MTQATLSVSGIGLVTGQPSSVEVEQLPSGSGIVFVVNGSEIPAHPEFIINTDRGVTLGTPAQPLCIVEHFLSACAMTGHTDLQVVVNGAPELPILDGSSLPWVEFLTERFGSPKTDPTQPPLVLKRSIHYQDPQYPNVRLMAVPSETLEISYLVDFNHPELTRRWLTWREEDGQLTNVIAPARTFGYVSELPALQARGLALGASLENALGITDEGSYTSPLRLPDEPVRHKILDLIGDLLLCGVPIRRVKAHIVAFCTSHTAHLAFGKLLAEEVG